jgi:hypothetical protein
MIRPPQPMGAFEFVALAALRAAQLTRGCRPGVDGDHTTVVSASMPVHRSSSSPHHRTCRQARPQLDEACSNHEAYN